MSDKFNGFSQEEILRASSNKNKKNAEERKKPVTYRGHGGIRRIPDKNEFLHQQKMSQKPKAKITTTNTNLPNNSEVATKHKNIQLNDSIENTNLDRSMSKSIEEALFYQPMKSVPKISPTNKTSVAEETLLQNHFQKKNIHSQDSEVSNDSSILKLSTEVDSQISSLTSSKSLDESLILPSPAKTINKSSSQFVAPSSLNVQSPFKGISLKDFESHRKMIEEQNRQKKELLHKAIEQHSQKTAAETRKIEEIKAELAKLDNDLAVDVALLRKQIDNACIHFAAIEKHYMKIESQFLKAKLDLHNALEKKELLTEHLCTVIAHNEDRKAQKLTELMEKVGLAANGEYEHPASS